MSEYYRVIIGAISKEEAIKILEYLIENKLIAGGKYFRSDSIHRWQGKIDHEPYYTVMAYTISLQRDKIIDQVSKIHSDEVPAIYFDKIDYGSKTFLKWIEDNVE